MALSEHLGAYDDCVNAFERAAEDSKGIRIGFDRESPARHFMFRMHQARTLLRREAKRMYNNTDIRWGKSAFETFVVRLPVEDSAGRWWVYIEQIGDISTMDIEALSKVTAPRPAKAQVGHLPMPRLAPPEPKVIEHDANEIKRRF